MRHAHQTFFVLSALLIACNDGGARQPDPVEPVRVNLGNEGAAPKVVEKPRGQTARAGEAAPKPAEVDDGEDLPGVAVGDADEIPAEDRVLVVIEGEERILTTEQSDDLGYDRINFRNDWVPFIFQPRFDADGDELPNRYRRIFVGLANDNMDGDGRDLNEKERNYLEVFGIPPAIGVVHARFIEDDAKACHQEIDYDFMASQDRIQYRNKRRTRRHRKKVKDYREAVDKAMAATGAADTKALLKKKPKLEKAVAYLDEFEAQIKLLDEIEKRLDCDEHNHPRYKHKKGELDRGLRLGVRRFQRKHKIYEHTNLRNKTMRVMAMRPVVTNHMALRRALEERISSAAGIVEDGSYPGRKNKKPKPPPTYTGADGEEHPLRNLIKEFTDAAMTQLGIDTPEKALAFMKRRSPSDFETLHVGVKFPPKPEYYQPHMELSVEIDRGDVFYDPPWDDEGNKRKQYRKRLPKYSLFTTYRDQKIRLVYWPTTIGGWRAEVAKNGYEYYSYKQSYVGERVIKKIIAGPTWVPPESTPLRSLAKRRYINGGRQGVVNYSEMGPGYLSAYGLVAGYFVKQGSKGRDWDQGIRVHGSSDYMSILSPERYSHGCHRLMNHHAVRLYGHILRHRKHEVKGDQPINHRRQFYYEGEVFQVSLPTRGFKYAMDPPIPVTVKRGRVRGNRSRPPEGLVKIPDKRYPKEEEEEPEQPGSQPVAPPGTTPVPDALPMPAAPAPALPAPTTKKDTDA